MASSMSWLGNNNQSFQCIISNLSPSTGNITITGSSSGGIIVVVIANIGVTYRF